MTSASDGLIDHLLFNITLKGSQGLSATDFAKLAVQYHEESKQETDPQADEPADYFLSAKPPVTQLVIDSSYLKTTWNWIRNHNDILHKSKSADPVTGDEETIQLAQLEDFLRDHAGDRLYASESRIWQTVAGHAVDWKKLPKLEFQCLCVIAAHGPSGVLQPDIVALTGQDKRSVPKRTDSLASKGYVTKEPCQGGGTRTSLLTLKRFKTQGADTNATVKLLSTTARKKDDDNLTQIYRYEEWYEVVVSVLSTVGEAVPYDDLRQAAGVVNDRFGSRGLNRCMWRLADCGLVERTLRHNERGVKLLRKPTQLDKDTFVASLKKGSLYNKYGLFAEDEDGDLLDAEDQQVNDLSQITAPDNANAVKEPEESSTLPIWTPNLPFANLFFDAVESFGARGASSFELCNTIASPFWQRPFDEMAARITDEWPKTQPPHLLHLAVVRDTRVQGTTTHYIFRTLQNFQKAVENGEAAWDYILTQPGVVDALRRTENVDTYGFPVNEASEFHGHGRSPVTNCARSARPKPSNHKPGIHRRQSDRATPAANEEESGNDEETISATTPVKKRAYRSRVSITLNVDKKAESWTKRYHEACKAWNARVRANAIALIEAGHIPTSTTLSDVPQLDDGKLNEVITTLLTLARPGAYINEPRAVMVHRDTSTPPDAQARGRPRSGLLLTVKSAKLRALSWFVEDPTAAPSRRLLRLVPDLRADPFVRESPPSPVHSEDENAFDIDSTQQGKDVDAQSSVVHEQLINGERQGPEQVIGESSGVQLTQAGSKGRPVSDQNAAPTGGVQDDVSTDAANSTSKEYATVRSKRRRAPSEDDHASLPADNDLSNDQISGQATNPALTSGLGMFDMVNPRPTKKKRVFAKRQGVTRSGGLVEYSRSQIILDIVSICGGVFPEKTELYYPFASNWFERYAQVPDRTTLARSLQNLISAGKLVKVTFSFQAPEGFPVIKYLLTEPGIEPTDPRARHVQKEMQRHWPTMYMPPEVPISKTFRQRLLEVDKMTLERSFRLRRNAKFFGDTEDSPMGVEDDGTPTVTLNSRKSRYAEEDSDDTSELDEDALEMISEFQLDSYSFAPEDARIDRGRHGKSRLGRRVIFDSARASRRGPSLGTLKELRSKAEVGVAATTTSEVPTLAPRPDYQGINFVDDTPGQAIYQPLNRKRRLPDDDDDDDTPEATFSPSKPKRARAGLLNITNSRLLGEDIPMTILDKDRLLYAVAVVKTLTGGLQQGKRSINFSLVNQALHFKFDGKYCRDHWNHERAKHEAFVDRLQERFRRLFLDAYERGELPIPELHFAVPEKIPWAQLVDWAQAKLSRTAGSAGMLPDTRAEFQALHTIDQSQVQTMVRHEQDGFFAPTVSSVRKEDMVSHWGYHDPMLVGSKSQEAEADRNPLAESWIRANILTPAEDYDADAAHAKLSLLGDTTLSASKDSMLGKRLIRASSKSKRRTLPSRSYMMSDELKTIHPLPWHWTDDLFFEAARFKQDLDTAFAHSGSDDLRADTPRSDAETLVVLNLVSNARITLKNDLSDANLSKWGFTTSGYKTMQIDKDKLSFPLHIAPTAEYEEGVAPLLHPVPAPLSKRFPGEEHDRIPYWATIHGELMPRLLRQLTVTLLYILMQRPGVDETRLARILKGRFWAWELRMWAEWACEVGLVQEDGAGWELGEYWWLADTVL